MKPSRIVNNLELVSRSPRQTQALGHRIGKLAAAGDVLLLVGQLGSGKTCLTQGIAWGLGSEDYAASPSFIIVREHYGRLPLYHADLYRLDRIEEIDNLGLDEYLYGQGVCVIEWAEKGRELLPPEHLIIEIDYLGEAERRLRFGASGRRYQELLAQIADINIDEGAN